MAETWIAVAPGAAWATKRWPAERFRTWVRAQTVAGRRVIAFGTDAERTLCEQVTESLPGAVSAAGETSLPLLAAVLEQASLFLGNDSGAGHLAAAVGTPVATLFGPTVPAMGFAPQGERNRAIQVENLTCRPCHRHGPARCPRGHFRCMLDLEPDQVSTVTEAMLR